MKSVSVATLLLACTSCNVAKNASFNPEKKYGSQHMQQDFSILRKVLESNHPGLYWYATKDSVDRYFAQTLSSLTDSLTEQQFRNRVSWAINKIHCGHTTVRSSKQYANYYAHRKTPQFPLSLKVWADSAVVIANSFKDDSVIKRGTVITGINELSTKQILDSICQFIGTDGYANNFRYQLISFNFPGWYRNIFGTDSLYKINYIDSLGKSKQITLSNYGAKADSLVRKEPFLPEGLEKKQLRKLRLLNDRSLQIDSSLNTAFLAVNTFSRGKLNSFFKRTFKTIRKKNIENVVLDLRLNSGGNVLSSTRLCQYLASKSFNVADTVAAFTRRFPYKKHIRPWFIYWLSMQVSGRKYTDGRIHFKYFENHYFKPMRKSHFDGKIYVMTGGYTFSAATLVTEVLKGQSNVTIVGEETGGGAYGNSAMFLTTIHLPNTLLRVTLPLYRMVLNANHQKNGRGVMPDVEVRPSSALIRTGTDAKLEKVKELIKQQKAAVAVFE